MNSQIEKLARAVRWALGYDEGPPDFHERREGDKPYYWRTELRRRSGLDEWGALPAVVTESEVWILAAGDKHEGCFPRAVFASKADAEATRNVCIEYDLKAPRHLPLRADEDAWQKWHQLHDAWVDGHPLADVTFKYDLWIVYPMSVRTAPALLTGAN